MSNNNIYTANQDIRDYMDDHNVTQRKLADQMGVSPFRINRMLKNELSQLEKEEILRHIDAIVEDNHEAQEEAADPVETEATVDVSVSPKFQIGDRVKIPAKSLTIGTVSDVWHSLLQDKLLYAVDVEGGSRGLYREDQLEPAPLPITYAWEAHLDGNVAVVTMNAKQGD
jgi:DNA-binding Lrp family transcriptional regulator